MKCEHPGCEKQKTCFHYCHEHHAEVCLKQRSRLTPLQADAAINNQNEGQAVAAAPLKPGR